MNTKINIQRWYRCARVWLQENQVSVLTGAATTLLMIITLQTASNRLTAHFWQRSVEAPQPIRVSLQMPEPVGDDFQSSESSTSSQSSPSSPSSPSSLSSLRPAAPVLVQEEIAPSSSESLESSESSQPSISSISSSSSESSESSESSLSSPPSQASTSSQSSTPTTSDFPPLGNAVHPVTRVPNWGAMRTPTEWNRTYNQMTDEDFVSIPRYDMSVLTTPMESLIKPLREENIPLITAKLYYSTRHMGTYDLDAGEHTGTHAGVDLKLALGTPIGTIGGGRVVETGKDFLLGNYVIIEHRIAGEGTYFSIYGHLDTISVRVGQNVTAGQMIGTVGMTGSTSGPHLHLQVDKDDGTNPHVRYFSEYDASGADSHTVNPIDFIRRY